MPNENVYEGACINGKFNGKGTLTLKDGTKKSGTWKNNLLVKTPKGEVANYQASDI